MDSCASHRRRFITWARGVHSSIHRPSGQQMLPQGYNNGLRGQKSTHRSKNNTTNTRTHTLMNECPTDFNSPLQRCRKFSRGRVWECVRQCVCVCVCIIKPSSNIYWVQMGGRMLPVSAGGNEGSGGMMKRWGGPAAMRGNFTYNGSPEPLFVSLSLSLPLWRPLMATEDQRSDADCFQSSFRWGERVRGDQCGTYWV